MIFGYGVPVNDPQPDEPQPCGWQVYKGEEALRVVFAVDKDQAASKGRQAGGDSVVKVLYRVEKENG